MMVRSSSEWLKRKHINSFDVGFKNKITSIVAGYGKSDVVSLWSGRYHHSQIGPLNVLLTVLQMLLLLW